MAKSKIEEIDLSKIDFSKNKAVSVARVKEMAKNLPSIIKEIESKRELNLDKLNSVVQF